MAIVEPKTRRFLIIGLIIVIVAITICFTIAVSTGNLDGDDVVKIIEAVGGIFKKAPQLK